MKTIDLSKYDGKIYSVRNTYALKFKSGSFHYVSKEDLKLAFENDFEVGYDKMTYTRMPWGMQHTGYDFESNETIISKFLDFLK